MANDEYAISGGALKKLPLVSPLITETEMAPNVCNLFDDRTKSFLTLALPLCELCIAFLRYSVRMIYFTILKYDILILPFQQIQIRKQF